VTTLHVRHSIVALLVLAWPAPQAPAPMRQSGAVAIRDATIVTGTSGLPVSHGTILIRGRTIEAVGSTKGIQIPPDAQVIDGRGRFVVPGLIDTHVHIAADIGTPRLELMLGYELANGVTGIRDASGMGRERELCALRDRIDKDKLVAPRLYVSGSATPQNLERYHAADWADLLRQLHDIGVDGIKLRNLTRTQAGTVIHLSRTLGLPPYGHTYGPGFNLDNFSLEALDAGVAGIMHVSGAGPASTLKPRPLLAVGWQRTWLGLYQQWLDATDAELQRLLEALLAHHAWLEPTLATESVFLYADRYRRRQETRWLWTPFDKVLAGFPTFVGTDLELARQGLKKAQAFTARFHAAGGLVLAGTDNMPWPGGLAEEVRLLVDAGLTPLAALQAATVNPAQALGWEKRTGAIAVGLDADLLILDADPLRDIRNLARIRTVVRAGHVLDRAALDRMLK